MAKYSISKKTGLEKVLVCVLYHNINIDLLNLIKNIGKNKNTSILIIVDGNLKIKNKNKILKLNNKIKFKYSLKKKTVSYNRNIAIKFAKNAFDLILYIDSDVIPEKNILSSHVKNHIKNKHISIIGGPVIPSFFNNSFNFWEMLDGCLSWFTSTVPSNNKIIQSPYHLPTCNLSIKLDFLFRNKIMFDEKLKTGEDVDLCNKVRKKNGKILLIKSGKVFHQDRKDFSSFFYHHANWGRHQFYTLYKKKFSNYLGSFLFNLTFFIFYPLLMPILNFLSTLLTIIPWVRFRFIFIFLIIPTYLVHLIKGGFTYLEFFKNIKS